MNFRYSFFGNGTGSFNTKNNATTGSTSTIGKMETICPRIIIHNKIIALKTVGKKNNMCITGTYLVRNFIKNIQLLFMETQCSYRLDSCIVIFHD